MPRRDSAESAGAFQRIAAITLAGQVLEYQFQFRQAICHSFVECVCAKSTTLDEAPNRMLPASALHFLLAIAIVSYLVGYLAAQTRFPNHPNSDGRFPFG